MNTARSFWLGWGSLCVAGAGAYFFAKKQIKADRHAKLEAQRQRREENQSLEYGATSTSVRTGISNGGPESQEAGSDPAPTKHATEKSQYESRVPYRSPKGDRFS